jgi:hypothetical protein
MPIGCGPIPSMEVQLARSARRNPAATASRSRWKTHESCGSDDPNEGRKNDEKATAITCVFLDIGGVLLTDWWVIMPANGR